MPPPKSPSDLCQFMGMVTQLGSFTRTRDRFASHYRSHWVQLQEETFALTQPAVMVYYDSAADTNVSADTSSHGLGAMLLQLHNNSWKPVAFASCIAVSFETYAI